MVMVGDETKALRLGGYIRVSKVGGRQGETFISPAVQAEHVERHCHLFGHQLAFLHTELDESGRRGDRPLLLDAIERIECGEIDGLIVPYLSRFGRNLVDGINHVERIQQVGGTFISVAERFDLRTDVGKLMFRQMLSFAEFESDRVKTSWREARSRAIARGIHITQTVPFGYQRRDDGGLEPHPVNGPLVTELYRRRAEGSDTWREIAEWLNGTGAVTAGHGRPWSLRSMKDVIRNDVNLGVASHGEFRLEGAHEPLVDRATWERAQRPGTVTAPQSITPALLGGLLRCAGCRYAMGSAQQQRASGDLARYYLCRTRRERQSTECGFPASGVGRDIERVVVEQFFAEAPRIRARAVKANPRAEQLRGSRAEALAIRDQWRDDLRAQAAGMDVYMAGLETRQANLDAIDEQIAHEEARAGAVMLPEIAELRARWDGLDVRDRRVILGSAIQCVFLHHSRDLPVAQRVRVVWHGESVDLPRRGHRAFVVRPFDFDRPDGVRLVASDDR